jgi:hypothetical protein
MDSANGDRFEPEKRCGSGRSRPQLLPGDARDQTLYGLSSLIIPEVKVMLLVDAPD